MRKLIVIEIVALSVCMALLFAKADSLANEETIEAAEVKIEEIRLPVVRKEVSVKKEVEPKNEYFFYEIPEEYQRTGGELECELQEYIQDLCKEKNISFPLIIAMIERESGYKNEVNGDGGASIGYMQVMGKWHEERMERLNCTDLTIPEENIAVAVDILLELKDKYGELNMVLMCYNMGESRARELLEKGIFDTKYSDYIIEREYEISKELYGG